MTDMVNNKLASGRVELVVTEAGELCYKLDGADTVYPFRRTDIVMEYMYANGYGQAGNSRTMTYTAKYPCTLHIRACSGAYGSNRASIQSYLNSNAYSLRTVQGYCGETHMADIALSKNDVFSVSCSINSNGGAISLVGYID